MYVFKLVVYPIIPGLFLVLFVYHYSQNCSSIMCACRYHNWQLLMLLYASVFAWSRTMIPLCILVYVLLDSWAMKLFPVGPNTSNVHYHFCCVQSNKQSSMESHVWWLSAFLLHWFYVWTTALSLNTKLYGGIRCSDLCALIIVSYWYKVM